MILYCDTSALVKLYIRETGSDSFREVWRRSPRRATADIAFAEALAAFARRWREGDMTDEQHDTIVERFRADFLSTIRIPQSDQINVRLAGLVKRHALRGFDALHLASAGLLRDGVKRPVLFACYDTTLNRAAKGEEFQLLESDPGERTK